MTSTSPSIGPAAAGHPHDLSLILLLTGLLLLTPPTSGGLMGPDSDRLPNDQVIQVKKDPYGSIRNHSLTTDFTLKYLNYEYVFYPGGTSLFTSYLSLLDNNASYVIGQNLGRWLEHAFNDTFEKGHFPSFTVNNATLHKNITYNPKDLTDMRVWNDSGTSTCKSQFTKSATVPPYDLIIEIPGADCTYHLKRTLIDFQSWGLVRWRLSDSDYIGWNDIKDEVEALKPSFPDPDKPSEQNWDVMISHFKIAVDPCIPDFFLLYLIVGDKKATVSSQVHQIYAYIPAFQLNRYNMKMFMNLTGSFCTSQEEHSHEECGYPQQLVLTNEHIVALTDKGIYVSSSLIQSDAEADSNYTEKPLLSYELRDPCEKFDRQISCFKQGRTSLSYELIHSIRLFYTPVCFLHQYPFYEDRLILAIVHTVSSHPEPDEAGSSSSFNPPVRAITILYSSSQDPDESRGSRSSTTFTRSSKTGSPDSWEVHRSKPYTVWRALFIGKHIFETHLITDLVGIFFNHQLRQFDITIQVMGSDKKDIEFRRFALPDPRPVRDDDSPEKWGYESLNSQIATGFKGMKFPGNFQLREVTVNPGTMDVFFLGNQLWIAESGLAAVYKSVEGLQDRSIIEKCHFNHPDRTYVCVSSNKKQIIFGRVAAQYSPSIVDLLSICEMYTIGFVDPFRLWTPAYMNWILENAIFIAGYSGNIMMWHLSDSERKLETQLEVAADPRPANETCADESYCPRCLQEDPVAVEACQTTVSHLKDPNNTENLQKGTLQQSGKGGVGGTGPVFKVLPFAPYRINPVAPSTDGPLVPFLIEGATVLLYEATLPGDDDSEHTYFSRTNFGKLIHCRYTIPPPTITPSPPRPPPAPGPDPGSTTTPGSTGTGTPTDSDSASTTPAPLPTTTPTPGPGPTTPPPVVPTPPPGDPPPPYVDKNCQLYVRHIKPTVPLLVGFRQVMYASVLQGIALGYVRCEAYVLQIPKSNRVFVKVTKHGGSCQYDPYHVGWTHWFPGKTSVLLQGFPDPNDPSVMMGHSTQWVYGKRTFHTVLKESWLMDLSTETYRKKRLELSPGSSLTVTEQEYENFKVKYPDFDVFAELEEAIQSEAEDKPKTTPRPGPAPGPPAPPGPTTTPKPVEGETTTLPVPNKNSSWTIEDGGCHHILELVENPVLKGNGGRVPLDAHDSLSFSVRLRPTTPMGRLSLYRPLFVVTNSNPRILSVKKLERLDAGEGSQTADITLVPSGLELGLSSVSIRSVISSTRCQTPLSLTFMVQVRREFGRRIWVSYPIPICKSHHFGQDRQWKPDLPFCTPPQLLLDAGSDSGSTELRLQDSIVVFYKLPKNYRPPSERGEQIPLSTYTYNAHPEDKLYNNFYHITNDTKKLRKCSFRKNRTECCCSDADRLSDHPDLTDCKEMVYTVPRGKQFQINLEYDPIMQDEDQNPDFFTSQEHLSVYVEEINNRKEFIVESGEPSPLLETINSDPILNEGRTFYNGDALNITLHGTGLFHFKVGLGRFDSLEEVTGYFTIYSDSNELNHIKLVVVMLLTITFCFSLVFLGFLRVRKRLSSQLPFQTRAKTKFKVE